MRRLKISNGLIFIAVALIGCSDQKTSGSLNAAASAGTDLTADQAAAELRKAGPQLADISDVSEVDAYRCGDGHKIWICHVPPGNPGQRHTLCVGAPAIPVHLKHEAHDGSIGDYVGQCVTETPPPADGGTETGSSGTEGSGGSVGGTTGGSTTGGSTSGGSTSGCLENCSTTWFGNL
jgi:hypothetical protein